MTDIEALKGEIVDKLRFCVRQEMWEGVDKLSLAYSRLGLAEARMGAAADGVHAQ